MTHYVLTLVYSWMVEHPEYYSSWVKPYTQLRWSHTDKRMIKCSVGGHWRRHADWATVLPTLRCTAKFEMLGIPKQLGTPMHVARSRWDEMGMIPRQHRVWVFV